MNGKEIRPGFFSRNPRFDYLPESDRYLLKLPDPKYKFNVIGAGMIGQEHINTTMYEGRAKIHGIYDTNPSSIQQTQDQYRQNHHSELIVYDSVEQACQDPLADAILICTPNHTHIDVVRTALNSGKHIFLEKPMATNVPDAWEIHQMARDYPAVFQVGLQYRYKSMYVEAIHEALDRRSIGEVMTISILEHRIPFLDKVGQWNKFSKYSGGTLVEKCCHYFDLMNLFAGAKPESVFASGSMAVNFKTFEYKGEKADILDNAFVIVEYANGVRATFNLCMFAPIFHEQLILCGDSGRLKAEENIDFIGTPRVDTRLEIMPGESLPARITKPAYPFFIEDAGHEGSTYFEHVYFVDNIEGIKTNTATTLEGLWSILVGVAAEESAQTGEVVRIGNLLERYGIDAGI